MRLGIAIGGSQCPRYEKSFAESLKSKRFSPGKSNSARIWNGYGWNPTTLGTIGSHKDRE
jgi:hypothetical protein